MKQSTTFANGLQIYRRLLGYMWHYWYAFILGIIGMILSAGTDAGFTWLLRPILDDGFIGKDPVFLHALPFIILGAFVLRGIASFLADYFISWIGRNIVMRFRQMLFEHFMFLPASFYDSKSSGQLLSAIIYNVEQVAKASTNALVTLVRETAVVLGLITVMLMNSWRLTMIFVLTVPVISLIIMFTSRRMRHLSRNIQNTMSEVTHITEESLEGYRVIKSFGGQDYEMDKFNEAAQRNRQREMKVVVTDSIGSSLVQMSAACAIATTIFLATSTTKYGISTGAFVAMVAAMLAILKPMKNLTNVNSTIQKGIAGAESVFAILDDDLEKDTGIQTINRAKGELQFNNIRFHYPGHQKNVLNDIQLTIQPGETVALVGRSGSGKSTLASLIPRFYECSEGSIQLDGINIKDLTLQSLREQIAQVTQHVTLFNDTIAKNIAYGQLSKITQHEIEQAAIAAHAIEFIRELPDSFDTHIGENGVLLSGGQRQRLAIARALLKDAPVLILDEATSSLDTESEYYIQRALERLMKNRTTIVIAHRLSTIENADRIVVLERGQILEVGTHQELLARNNHYAKLHALQFNEKLDIHSEEILE